jgi:nucleotide sugar dehydrogenase
MKNGIKLAVVGSGVVGGGVLHTWHHRGYEIVGYDVNPNTITDLRSKGLACEHMDNFINCQADMIFICISTPQSEVDGSIYLDYMRAGLKTIGPWLMKRVAQGHYPMVVMRSTMLPKLSQCEIIPQLEAHSGMIAGSDFGYAFMPEILRETDANQDEANIWQIVIGALDNRTGNKLAEMLGQVFGEDKHKLINIVPLDVAEASKIIVNTYNATIISYFNQMGLWLKTMDIDGQHAIDLAMRMCEGSLNPWYGTASGYPYGGKCLPKDVAAVLAMARQQNMEMPQLQATQDVNDIMVDLAESNQVPKPVKGGFRRMSARMLRRQALNVYDLYQALTTPAPLHTAQIQAQAQVQSYASTRSGFKRVWGYVGDWRKALRQRFAAQPRLGA